MTNISSALTMSSEALSVLQKSAGVIGENIYHASDPDYTRQGIGTNAKSINGLTTGTMAGDVFRHINKYLQQSVWNEISTTEELNVIQQYAERAQGLMGIPTDSTGLHKTINDFFAVIKTLSTTPESPTVREAVKNQALDLISSINKLSNDIQSMRQQADMQMSNDIEDLNIYLENLYKVNQTIVSAQSVQGADADVNQMLDGRDKLVKEISKILQIRAEEAGNKAMYVSAVGAGPLVQSLPAHIHYAPAVSISAFTNNDPLSAITSELFVPTDSSESITANLGSSPAPSVGTFALMTSGTQGNIKSNIAGGSLSGLKYIRDEYLPNLLAEIDQLATVLSDSFNAIHNLGSGYPPAVTLTGTELLNVNENRNFSGSVNIALVNLKDGTPFARQDGTLLPPLTLHLDTINSGSGAGKVAYKTIIDEINQYFSNDQKQNRAALGDLHDIKIAATSSTISPTGTFSFDFELKSLSQTNSVFKVLGVSANHGITAPGTLPSDYTIVAGNRMRTGAPISFDFSTATTGGPHTISVQVEVDTDDGGVYTATLDYVVDDNPTNTNILNQRYALNAVSAGASSILVPPNNVKSFAQAQFVDDQGNLLNNLTEEGYMQLSSLDSKYGIVINEVDSTNPSKELGQTVNGVLVTQPTNRSFSHYLGMNNFFVNTPTVLNNPINDNPNANRAISLGIRSDIIADSDLITAGEMVATAKKEITVMQGVTAAQGRMDFALATGLNFAQGDTVFIQAPDGTNKTFTFKTVAAVTSDVAIGANAMASLQNLMNAMNANNSFTSGYVNQASYSIIPSTLTLVADYKTKGVDGNSFRIGANIVSGNLTVDVNNKGSSNATSDNLLGGTKKDVTQMINTWTFSLGRGAHQVADKMYTMSRNKVSFGAAGNIYSQANTLEGYASAITSTQSNLLHAANNDKDKADFKYKAVNEQNRAISGVNTETELINMQLISANFNATLVVRDILLELYQKLLQMR